MPLTSVLIAVRNDPVGLAETLAALARQTVAAGELEVIVIDDGSTGDALATAAAVDGVRLLRLDSSGGAYAARNAGFEHSRGEVIAITDAGCVPAPDWIERGRAGILEDEMTVVAGRIAMPLGPRPSLAAMVDVIHHLDQYRYVTTQGAAVTANLLAGRRVFETAGLFDSSLTSSGDREWVARARSSGARLTYADECVVTHPPRSSAIALLRKSARVARGASIARARGGATAPASAAPYRSLGVLKPRNRARGRERITENGAEPTRLRWLAVGAAQVLLVQLPQAASAAYWDARLGLRARGRGRAHRNGAGPVR